MGSDKSPKQLGSEIQSEESVELEDGEDQRANRIKSLMDQVDFGSIHSNIDNLKNYLENDINNVQDLKVFLDIIKDQQLVEQQSQESDNCQQASMMIFNESQKIGRNLVQK